MAAFKNAKDIVINIDSSTSDDSSDEIEFIKELKTRVTDHRCDLCCEGEVLIDKLLRFGGLINEEYKFVCEKCDKNFVHKSKLTRHLAQCKGSTQNRESPFVNKQQTEVNICSVCSKNFKTKGVLTKHLKNQHSGLIHTCEICRKNFSNFQKFRVHCLKHQQMRYVCTICKKRFHYESNLRKHIANHNTS